MDRLSEEIAIEEKSIETTLKLLEETLNRPGQSAIEFSAIGSFMHHCYTGMENIIKRILKFRKVKIRDSVSSHKDLLNIAVHENLISQDLSDKLDKYRGFRHFFTHAYGFMLEEEKLRPLASNLSKAWEQFKQEIDNTLDQS